MSILQTLGHGLLLQMDAETAHGLTIKALQAGLAKGREDKDPKILKTRLPVSGMELSNPVGLAAGFDKNAEVFAPMLGFGFGFVECGTVTPLAQPGNPKPRLFRLKEDMGVINRMGFNNEGLEGFVARLEAGAQAAGVVGANVGANKVSEGADRVADYVTGLQAVWPHCSYVTINISSPNTPGLRGLQERGALEELLGAVSVAAVQATQAHGARPLFLKIAPDVDETAVRDIVEVALKTDRLTGLIVSNTTIERPDSLQSAHKTQAGGLSGKPLFELSTEVLRQVAVAVDGRLDLIGAGGVHDADTAYAKIRAGAHAIQLYSALVYGGASMVRDIRDGLAKRLRMDGFMSVSDAVGADLK